MWCRLKQVQWQIQGHDKADPVTIKCLQDQIAALEDPGNPLDKKKLDDKKGCKHLPLITNIKLEDNCLMGVLHCLDLHINHVFKEMAIWVHWRIEPEEEEIKAKRQELAEAMLIKQERSMEVEEFKMDVAITAANLEAFLKSSEGKEHSKLYKRRKKKKNKTTQGEISRLEELQDGLELWKNPKVEAEKESKKLTKLLKEAKSERSGASTSLNTATKKKGYGAMTQVRRQNIEELMELLFGII